MMPAEVALRQIFELSAAYPLLGDGGGIVTTIVIEGKPEMQPTLHRRRHRFADRKECPASSGIRRKPVIGPHKWHSQVEVLREQRWR